MLCLEQLIICDNCFQSFIRLEIHGLHFLQIFIVSRILYREFSIIISVYGILIETHYYHYLWGGRHKLTYSPQSFSANDSESLQNGTLNTTFVLLECEEKMIESVLEKIRLISIVSDVKQVQGAYDIVIRLEASSYDTIQQTIAKKIRIIKGIRTGITLHGIKSLSTVQRLWSEKLD